MQTFDTLLPASNTSRTHDSEANFAPKKPSQNGEKFGAVMDRALSRTPNESNGDDSNAPTIEKSRKKDPETAATTNHPVKRATKSKKPLTTEPDKNDDEDTQPIASDTAAAHLLQPTVTAAVPDDEGSLDNVTEAGTEKSKQTTGTAKSDDASKSSTAQFLALAGLVLGIASPTSSPQGPVGSNGSLKEAKGNSTSVPNVSTKPETSGVDSSLSEISNSTGKIIQADSDPKSEQAKGSADHSENTLATGDAGTQDQPTQSGEPNSNNAGAIAALAAPLPDSENTQADKPKTSTENISVSASDPHGTSAAKHYITMKKAEKTPKVAGPTEQDLPGEPTVGSEELLTGEKLSARDLTHSIAKLDSTVTVEAPAATRISVSPDSAAPTITSAAVAPATNTDSRLRVLERTHDIVALHAMRLGQTGMDSLHVVVKPGEGIQLSLELRQTEGSIEVRASLHKGDFEHLKQYWPELQQRLEARGVRVGALTCSDNFSSTSHQQFQQSKQQFANQDPLYAGAFAEFALAGSMSEAPATRAARATAYRGWETWA